jgi:hypothetical protein
MQYHGRMTSSGRIILSRSSFRYLFFAIFLSVSLALLFLGLFSGRAPFPLPSINPLLVYAGCLISASASFIILMNRGSPSRIVIDGDGIILIHPGKSLRVPKGDVRSIREVDTITLPDDLNAKKRAITRKVIIELANDVVIPVYEGPNESRSRNYVEHCRRALENGPVYVRRGLVTSRRESNLDVRHGSKALIGIDESRINVRVPIKVDVPSFLMGAGMLAGFGIILFSIIPGKIDATIVTLSTIIWGLIALSMCAAFAYALFGKQKLLITDSEVECRRRFLGINLLSHSLKRAEAGRIALDLEQGRLSILSKELNRMMSGNLHEPMGEKMGELLGGKSVRLDLSSLLWSERIELERAITSLLDIPEPQSQRQAKPDRGESDI